MASRKLKENEEEILRKDFDEIISTCLSYMSDCDIDEVGDYCSELAEILCDDCAEGKSTEMYDEDDNLDLRYFCSDEQWKKLLSSGIFHDAEGPIVRKNESRCVICTVY